MKMQNLVVHCRMVRALVFVSLLGIFFQAEKVVFGKSLLDGVPQWFLRERAYKDLKIVTNFPPVAAQRGKASILLIGDTGQEGILPLYNGRVLGKICKTAACEMALHSGDNIYPAGVKSLNDIRFTTLFENIFSASSLEIPFYMSLGNHDYYSTRMVFSEKGIEAQVEYTQLSKRWRLYSRWYAMLSPYMTLVVLDSNFNFLGSSLVQKQKNDVRQFIQNWLFAVKNIPLGQRPWLVFMAHHPRVSSPMVGHLDEDADLMKWYDELACVSPKHFFVFGHLHFNEILFGTPKKGCPSLSVISGGAIHRSRALKKSPESLYLNDQANSTIHLQLDLNEAKFSVYQIDPFPAETFKLVKTMGWSGF